MRRCLLKRYRQRIRRRRMYIRRNKKYYNNKRFRKYYRHVQIYRPFANLCKHIFTIERSAFLPFQYGCGMYDYQYKEIDYLVSKFIGVETDSVKLLQSQYAYYMINKVCLEVSDIISEVRCQGISKGSMNFKDTALMPFTNGSYYEYIPDAFKTGIYLRMFRSTKDEGDISMLDVNKVKCNVIRKPRKIRYYFYPRNYTAIAFDENTFKMTIGEQLSKMNPRTVNFFRINWGWGPNSNLLI